jgi:hypothetical protein
MEQRRYRAMGGMLSWRIPMAAAVLMAALATIGDWTITIVLAVVALGASAVERSIVLVVSERGLTREIRLAGRLVRPATCVPWDAVRCVATRWARPGDYTVLQTIVTGDTGDQVRFGSRMGMAAYRELVTCVLAAAPRAAREGLTDQLVCEALWQPTGRLVSGAIAAMLMLVVLALMVV